MINQQELQRFGSENQIGKLCDFVSHLRKKKGCVSLSFVLPFTLVLLLYFDEALFADADLSRIFLPLIFSPALLAGTTGFCLYAVIKFVRFLCLGKC